jgi:UPF0755 protein
MIRLALSSLKILTIVLTTGVVVLGGGRAFEYATNQAHEEAGVGQPVTITIGKKDEASDVAKKLRKAGLIRSESVFELTLRYVNRDIKPQTYQLRRGMPVKTIVDLITTEKSKAVTKNKTLKLTVPEGWRTEQIAEELERIGANGGARGFLEAVEEYPHDSYDFLEGAKEGSLEGFLFPATYEFKSDTAPDEIVTMMLNAFDQNVTPEMRQRAEEMGLTLYEVLKVAALVEREAAVADERPIIADVYLKRLADGWTLDADPTVQYAIGKRDGEWWPRPTGEDLENIDSKYNLYKHTGLTPTPICNPGQLSIIAVLNPAETPFYYFVARDDESRRHLFAATNDEQSANLQLVDSGEDLSEYDEAYTQYIPAGFDTGRREE